MTANAPALAMGDVRYIYPSPGGGVVALDGVTIEIPPGQTLAVAGQNGSGKTTFSKLVNGLLHPTSGSVSVHGQDTSGRRVQDLARHVGYVFQNPNHQLFARSVREELAFGPRNLGIAEAEIAQRVGEVAEAFGLTGQLGDHPYHLGFPIRKLVSIASVVTMRPSIMVLDEPTTGQDHRTTDAIVRVIRELRDSGVTVVCISHDMDLVVAVADRVVVLQAGRVVADGTPRVVLADQAIMSRTRLRPPQVTRLSLALPGGADRPAALTVEELLRDVRSAGLARVAGLP
jgi:energy-coupling factor transporter ATP-binding protein EcfA2